MTKSKRHRTIHKVNKALILALQDAMSNRTTPVKVIAAKMDISISCIYKYLNGDGLLKEVAVKILEGENDE